MAELSDFERLVKEMRAMQRQFFRTRDAMVLREAKKLEWQVDAIIEQKEKPEDRQLELFGEVK